MRKRSDNNTKLWVILGVLAVCIVMEVVLLILGRDDTGSDSITVINEDEIVDLVGDEGVEELKTRIVSFAEAKGLVSDGADMNDIVIREGTVKKSVDDETGLVKTTTFLIDIDSLKQTYRVNINEADGAAPFSPVEFVCPPVSEMKYPDVACYDLYGGGSASLDNNTPYEFEMASGEEVLVKNVDYSGGGQEVQVEYSCGQGSVDTVESAVREWVATLHDPREDYYTYSIKNVECSKEN